MFTSHFLYAWHLIFPDTFHVEDRAESTAYNGCRTDDISSICPQHDTRNFILQDLCSTGAWHAPTPPSPPPLFQFCLYMHTYCIWNKSTNTHNVEKMVTLFNLIVLSFCSTVVDFQLLIHTNRSVVQDSINNGLMIPWVRNIITLSLKLPLLDIITSFIFSDDVSSLVILLLVIISYFLNPLCYCNHTHLTSVASNFSMYSIKLLETGIKFSTYPINMLTVQGYGLKVTLSPWLLVSICSLCKNAKSDTI